MLDKFKKLTPGIKYCVITPVILAILFLIGTADLEYGYYTFVRIISFFALIGVFGAFAANKEHILNFTCIASFIVWILFNPIIPISFEKETWVVFDILSAITMLAVSGYTLYAATPEERGTDTRKISDNELSKSPVQETAQEAVQEPAEETAENDLERETVRRYREKLFEIDDMLDKRRRLAMRLKELEGIKGMETERQRINNDLKTINDAITQRDETLLTLRNSKPFQDAVERRERCNKEAYEMRIKAPAQEATREPAIEVDKSFHSLAHTLCFMSKAYRLGIEEEEIFQIVSSHDVKVIMQRLNELIPPAPPSLLAFRANLGLSCCDTIYDLDLSYEEKKRLWDDFEYWMATTLDNEKYESIMYTYGKALNPTLPFLKNKVDYLQASLETIYTYACEKEDSDVESAVLKLSSDYGYDII